MNFPFHSLLVCYVLLYVNRASKLHLTPALLNSREYVSDLAIDYPLEDDVISTRIPLTSEEDEPTSTTRASTDSEENIDEVTSTLNSEENEDDVTSTTRKALNSDEDEDDEVTSTVSSKTVEEREAEKVRVQRTREAAAKVARTKRASEIAGKRMIKTHYGAYLRAWAKGIDWYVGAADEDESCEQWIVEQHDDKVAMKALCGGKYLRSNLEWYVDLADIARDHELWTPVKNDDRTWSFKSHHGTYLRAQPHGRVSMQKEAHGDEQFRLEEWTHEDTTTMSTTTTTTTTPPTTTEELKTTNTFVPANGPVNEVKTNVTIVLMMPDALATTTTTASPAATNTEVAMHSETTATSAPEHFSAVRDSLPRGEFTVIVMLGLLLVLSRTKSSKPVYEKVPQEV